MAEMMATVMTTDCVGLPSSSDARLIQVGLTALWLICEKNEKLRDLNLNSNNVGINQNDSSGLARMLLSSPSLVILDLSNNSLGELKQYALSRK